MNAATYRRPDMLDSLLVLIFLAGIYLGVNLNLAPGMPLPAAPAGAAGLLLLLRRIGRIHERHLIAVLAVILLYLVSILSAADYTWLDERFKGFVQLSYALVIGYGFFITLVEYQRERLARLFLGFCLFILVGCAFENYTGFAAVSDAVREMIFDFGIYTSDLRDQILYGRVRPKLFTSEPSAVTFAFTLYAFAWYVLSTWRLKLPIYLAMMACGFLLMRGPTLLLGLILIVPVELFLATRWVQNGRVNYSIPRLAATLVLTAVLLAVAGAVSTSFYSERIAEISAGSDPSFFFRVIGPALTAFEIVAKHPISGSGLTGEEFIEDEVIQVFVSSPMYSPEWQVERVAEVLTNYFWYHWIYLGAVWGVVMLVAWTWLLKVLGAPSALFCWLVWAILGQASGAYVSPKTWSVLLLACAVSVLHQREVAPVRYVYRVRPPLREGEEPRLRPQASTR